MRILKLISCAILLAGLASCGASTAKDTDADTIERQEAVTETATTENTANTDLITSVYDKFVFAIDSDGDEINNPEKYFTPGALKKLQDDYKFDCD